MLGRAGKSVSVVRVASVTTSEEVSMEILNTVALTGVIQHEQ